MRLLYFIFIVRICRCNGAELTRPPIISEEEASGEFPEDVQFLPSEEGSGMEEISDSTKHEQNDETMIYEPPTSVDYDVITTRAQLLTILNLAFKSTDFTCQDKNRRDCPVWAKVGYCNKQLRYSSWMHKNCPFSCGICSKFQTTTLNEECEDKSGFCDNLKVYCDIPTFRNDMTLKCKATCGRCNNTQERSSTGDYTGDAVGAAPNELIPKKWLQASRKTKNKLIKHEAKQEAVEGGDICFPTNCGKSPIVEEYKRMFAATRERRSVDFIDSGWQKLARREAREAKPSVFLKIVGGQRALRGEWPWHGLILQYVNNYRRYCGITIICKYWLVTAGHCINSKLAGMPDTREKMNAFKIFLARHTGLGYINSDEHMQEFSRQQIAEFIVHPNFTMSPTYTNDIALVKLNKAVTFSKYAQPICLPSVNTLKAGDSLTTYGWGATRGHGASETYLKKITLPFVTQEECKKKLWGLKMVNNICAGGDRYKDTCTGDSGGSLVKEDESGRYFMYGITSFGNSNCNVIHPSPGIYTDVAQYYGWIRKVTNSCCEETEKKSKDKNVVLKRRGVGRTFLRARFI